MSPRLEEFVRFSEAVTGFTTVTLHGTGHAQVYLDTVVHVAGDDALNALLDCWSRLKDAQTEANMGDLLSTEVFESPHLGPLARNIIKLWYVGTWYALPPEWWAAYGGTGENLVFQASPMSYTEGLLWPAMGVNPPGAKAPGYGSWTGPPRIGVD